MESRLSGELSPYLLKHAKNPVHWYPWAEEAFARARKEDRPVFLCIGYLTCHWCNVMDEESFSDPEVAELLNATFVNIKVDREERPDIDSVYMNVSVMLNGSGGWPLNLVLTPDGKPFFAATYIPKESRFGRAGLMELVPRIAALWKDDRERVMASAESITNALRSFASLESGKGLGLEDIETAYRELRERYDAGHGGFGAAPKFPTPHNLTFLLRYYKRSGGNEALDMALATLENMRRGGMYDQVGLGFHRYSTDRRWLVPHFEKMLYDQALLAMAYLEAYQITEREEFARTAREIFDYVMRDLRSPEGAFHSAQGADAGGKEGLHHVWRVSDVREAIGSKDAERAIARFGITPEGNFHELPEIGGEGANVLMLADPTPPTADEERIRLKLLGARMKRPLPDLDDKVLTGCNGLMVAALAMGGRVLGERAYTDVAIKSAEFVLKDMRADDGGLLHSWRGGRKGAPAGAEDYAYMAWGLIELYEASFEPEHLAAATRLMDAMNERFADKAGGYFMTPEGSGMIMRPKEVYDGAIPSYNSVAMMNLLRLARLTGNAGYEAAGARVSEAFAGAARRSPSAHTMLMSAAMFGLGPSYEVVIAGRRGADDTRELLSALGRTYQPQMSVVFVDVAAPEAIHRAAPYTVGMDAPDGKACAYVCRDFHCSVPTTSEEKMLELLKGGGKP